MHCVPLIFTFSYIDIFYLFILDVYIVIFLFLFSTSRISEFIKELSSSYIFKLLFLYSLGGWFLLVFNYVRINMKQKPPFHNL